jgi:hypothetical protein
LTEGFSANLFHRGLSQPQAMRQTYLRLYDSVITQATVLSYIDVAWLIAVMCLVMVPLALMMKKNDPKAAPGERGMIANVVITRVEGRR